MCLQTFDNYEFYSNMCNKHVSETLCNGLFDCVENNKVVGKKNVRFFHSNFCNMDISVYIALKPFKPQGIMYS